VNAHSARRSGHRTAKVYFRRRVSDTAGNRRFTNRGAGTHTDQHGGVAGATPNVEQPEGPTLMPAVLTSHAMAVRRRLGQLFADPRHFQIAALATLLAFNFAFLDFGARPLNSALAVASSLATQALCSRLWRLPAIDLRSALITGFSLSLLLRADEPGLHAVAAAIAIGSKFVLRIDGKHIWNPAGLAIVALIFVVPQHVWISPGQWGTSVWFAALVSFLAFMVLNAARRADVALFFLLSHGALLFARAAWLGDPPAIPLHQLQSGSLLIFAFFMISDPRTTPDSRIGRLVFAVAVALLAHRLAFFWQMRPALYVALIALSPATLLIDRIFPAERFAWTRPAHQGATR
jgi:Na+-transporting NADH:ubiquinone oxidoreductase subunit NqrB